MTKYGYMMDRDENGELIFSDLQKHILKYLLEVKESDYYTIYYMCLNTFYDHDEVMHIFWADFLRLYHAGIIFEIKKTTIIDEGYNIQSIINDRH